MEEGLKLLKVALEERRSVEVTLKQLEQTLNYTLHNASLPCRISSQVCGLRWYSAPAWVDVLGEYYSSGQCFVMSVRAACVCVCAVYVSSSIHLYKSAYACHLLIVPYVAFCCTSPKVVLLRANLSNTIDLSPYSANFHVCLLIPFLPFPLFSCSPVYLIFFLFLLLLFFSHTLHMFYFIFLLINLSFSSLCYFSSYFLFFPSPIFLTVPSSNSLSRWARKRRRYWRLWLISQNGSSMGPSSSTLSSTDSSIEPFGRSSFGEIRTTRRW